LQAAVAAVEIQVDLTWAWAAAALAATELLIAHLAAIQEKKVPQVSLWVFNTQSPSAQVELMEIREITLPSTLLLQKAEVLAQTPIQLRQNQLVVQAVPPLL